MNKDEIPLVLVTGASGYIAGHIIKQLCEQGYRVRGTVRKISPKQYQYLYNLAIDKEKCPIELVECDLSHDRNWDNAIEGCDYVIHTANVMPDSIVGPKGEPVAMTDNDFIPPVLKGMERILNACLKNAKTVKKLIYTTSVAAMDPEALNQPPDRRDVTFLTADDWTSIEKAEIAKTTGYVKSKTLAEKCAWDFVKKHNYPFELVTIAPAMTLGPVLTSRIPASMNLLKTLLNRQYPLVPNIHWKISDVRDVAAAHVNALTSNEANRNRYLVVNTTLWMSDIARFLDSEFGPKGYSIPLTVGPYWLFWIFGRFNPLVKSFVLPQYGKVRLCDSSPAIRDLDIVYVNARDILLDGAKSLIQHKLVYVPPGYHKTNATTTTTTNTITKAKL